VEAFRGIGHPSREPFLLTHPQLYAAYRYVDELVGCLRETEAIPVAVGSGTINDLVKRAAFVTGRQYLAVATAASVDGYTAYGASITHAGSKQTFDCPAPQAVVADLDVLAAAPSFLNAAGYADLQAKITAGADWLLAGALGIEPIEPVAWDLAQGRLREALADPDGVRNGDRDAIAALTEGLMRGGFAMQWSRTSRPASGAEHQFSHLWDMQHHTHQGQTPSHGFKVGIATLAVARLYEALLEQPLEALDVERCVDAWPDWETVDAELQSLFPEPALLAKAREETRAKHVSPSELRARLLRLRTAWPELRERLQAQLLPSPDLARRLEAVGAPSRPEQIGIPPDRLQRSFRQALYLRRRFTVLDLAAATGLL
jgi:glycerol-1-phosphate dehydrogenase [NAD(P)+]